MAARLITRQPFKALFLLAGSVYNGLRIPLWILYYIPSSLRQHPRWSFRQAFVVRLLKAIVNTFSSAEYGQGTPLKGNPNKGWVIVQPARASAYTGVVVKDKLTIPGAIGGTWYPKTLEKYNGEDIVFHVHGGAFVIGDGRAKDSGFTAKSILKNSKAAYAFFPQYRLSCNGARFPAALQDVITSYVYLTETVGIPASKITISGDSAGGNLAMSLLRYIADSPEAKLPNPVCAWIWSLWVDPGRSLITDPPFFSTNNRTDYLDDTFGAWGARTYTPRPETGLTMAHPNICFAGTAFATPTPLFFSSGEAEALIEAITKAAQELRNIPGNKVEIHIQDNAPHDIILLGDAIGFEKETEIAVKAAQKFLESVQ